MGRQLLEYSVLPILRPPRTPRLRSNIVKFEHGLECELVRRLSMSLFLMELGCGCICPHRQSDSLFNLPFQHARQ